MGFYNKNLDDIDFQIYKPHEILKPYIHSYWVVKKECFEQPLTLKILSDGSMGFVVNFSDVYNIEVNNHTTQCKDKFIIDGPTKYPSYISFSKNLDLIGIRFNPAGAYLFLDEEIENFVDKHIAMKESESWPLGSLYKNLIDEKTTHNKIAYIEKFLIHKLQTTTKRNSPWIFNFIQKAIAKKGDINVSVLSNEFKISIRQLERKFKQEVGLSPKLYFRILRLQNAKEALSSLNIETLTTTAHDSGFFDQAHFVREFKFFMKETPKNYLNNKRSLAKHHNYKTYSPIISR